MIKNLKSDSKFPDFQIQYLFVVKEKIIPQIFAKIKAKITELKLRKTTKKIPYENIVFNDPTKIYLNLSIIYDK
jgi:hypothetical protein